MLKLQKPGGAKEDGWMRGSVESTERERERNRGGISCRFPQILTGVPNNKLTLLLLLLPGEYEGRSSECALNTHFPSD